VDSFASTGYTVHCSALWEFLSRLLEALSSEAKYWDVRSIARSSKLLHVSETCASMRTWRVLSPVMYLSAQQPTKLKTQVPILLFSKKENVLSKVTSSHEVYLLSRTGLNWFRVTVLGSVVP